MNLECSVMDIESPQSAHAALIDPSAKIGQQVEIGPWSVIGPNVEIGDGTKIGSHVVIARDTKIGCNNRIYSYAALGADPQDLGYKGEPTFLEIGDGNVFREFVTVSRGSVSGTGTTRMGNKNCMLAYSHVAHDCVVGNGVLFVNNATLAGHVTVDDYATLGSFTAVHQFCRIGSYSFLSQGAKITRDILPYMLVTGESSTPHGLNTVGLRRAGFPVDAIRALKNAYHIIYRRRLKLAEVRAQLQEMVADVPEIQLILDMMDTTKRGIARQPI